ncbi:hypothetical protein SAMN06295960_2416 [Paenibacillus aquistagni]|uniref:Uncharacterized protein n=1 Tax=Paenibacillus aquistagni TaxID=1852522 RepID=A0A1X7KKI9_9BACL|nr:hypothetical protein SAMN06295960_2416 [Paenibacillus aquistagni]
MAERPSGKKLMTNELIVQKLKVLFTKQITNNNHTQTTPLLMIRFTVS